VWRAGEGRATLLVTHRLIGLERFDEVIVIEHGRVVERGHADELAARGGYFARGLAQQRAALALDDGVFLAAGTPASNPLETPARSG